MFIYQPSPNYSSLDQLGRRSSLSTFLCTLSKTVGIEIDLIIRTPFLLFDVSQPQTSTPTVPTTYYLYKTFFFSNTELNNLSMSLLDRLRSLSKLALILCASLKAISDLSERVVWTKNEHPSNRTPTPSGSLVTDVLTTQDQYYNPDTASYLVITF